jgi:hypothetical protein
LPLAPAKPEVSIVRFYLAAAILQTGGEEEEALRFLRRVGEERPWACSGVPQQEFSRDPAFEAARDDPEFLAVVNGWREVDSWARGLSPARCPTHRTARAATADGSLATAAVTPRQVMGAPARR